MTDDTKKLEKVKFALKKFLENKDKALCLFGKWGCGKTHLWKKIIFDNKNQCLPNYAYVSLFGIDSIKDAKYAIVADKIQKEEITEGSHDNIFSLKKVYPFILFIFGLLIFFLVSYLMKRYFSEIYNNFSCLILYDSLILIFSLLVTCITNEYTKIFHLLSINKISILGFSMGISPSEHSLCQ